VQGTQSFECSAGIAVVIEQTEKILDRT